VGIGLGILLVCWGLSWFWPHLVRQTESLKLDPDKRQVVLAPEQTTRKEHDGAVNDIASAKRTIDQPIIRRQVTEFRSVDHEAGEVTTGWQYADGRGGVPMLQYCYYVANVLGTKHKSDRVDIAVNGKALSDLDAASVPDPDGAKTKCQWWSTKELRGVSPEDPPPEANQ
jgi:hypothetical protein